MNVTVKQIGIILLVSGFLALVSNLVHPRRIPWVQDWSGHVEAKARKLGIGVIPLSGALERFKQSGSVFIDARSPEEYAKGHIPGSLSVPLNSLDEQFETIGNLIDSGRELVVYCRNRECDDALVLATELKGIGATNLIYYVDGFDAWIKYGGASE
ncbi:hypothetical protein PDESU_06442 [Pontiella desulfatans]|uniref:Rhodanese domain-containing protein n=1 Tax=Pontiella desulfatans TaxID=2750659 RepID=A0A6C2UCH6_PONDE|nr:rhodanese-like domain-containing protein [Pontiella desulfatans]VGO17840.1 hypothetical protein PDESU_06442 [Pontiella desulfatans]